MQISALARRLLVLVFSLSSSSASLTRPRLERRLGVSSSELTPAFQELSRLGLLDAQRLRLTLSGLAVAVACGSRARVRRPKPARKDRRVAVIQSPIALFSQREAPRAVA